MANSAIVGTLKAVLSADTAEFTRAMQHASAEVKELGAKLQKDLEPRQRAVNAAVKDFLGGNEIRRAQEYALAIEKIGDVTLLTAADQQKVNKAVNEALDHYKALGTQAPANLLALADATKKPVEQLSALQKVQGHVREQTGLMTSRVKEMALGFFTGQAAFEAFSFAGRKVVQFFSDSIKEALEAEQAQKKLTAALVAQGTATPAVLQFYEELSQKYQKTTVFSDELIKQQAALLTQMGGVLPREMDAALDAVTNLASGLGVDLESATRLVAKAFEDNFAALKKAGVQIDEARAKSEGMSYVLGQINAKFGGQAQADIESYAGQIKQLENNWSDLKEEMGKAIIETGLLDAAMFALAIQIELMQAQLKGAVNWAKLFADVTAGGFSTTAIVTAFAEFEARAKGAGTSAVDLERDINHLSSTIDKYDVKGQSTAQQKYWEDLGKKAKASADTQLEAMRNLQSGVDDLTQAQYDKIAALVAAGKAEGDIAKAYGFTAQQVKEVAAAEKGLADAEKEHLELSKKLAAANDAIRKKNIDDAKARQQAADDLSATLDDLTDAEIELIAVHVRAGKSTKDIALVYGFTEEQIRLVIEAEKDLSAVLKKVEDDAKRHHKAWADQFKATLKLEDEVDDLRARRTLSSTAFQQREIAKWAANQKAAYDQTKGDYDRFADAVDARAAELTLALNTSWIDSFDQVAAGFQQLAQIAGDQMGEVARAIGIGIASAGQFGKSIDLVKDSLKDQDLAKSGTQINAGGVAAGMLSMFGSMVAFVDAVDAALSTPQWRLAMEDVGRRWGVDISRGMSAQIAATQELVVNQQIAEFGAIEAVLGKTLPSPREISELLNLSSIIGDTGGLTTDNLEEWSDRARELFDVIAIGGHTGRAATEELSRTIGLFAAQADETGGLWSSAFQAIIADAKAAGIELDGLTDAINAQLDTAASATSKIVGGFVSTLPDLPEGERTDEDDEKIAAIVGNTQEQFDRVSRIALASFNAMVANGQSAAEAIAMIGPSIDDLAKKAEEFGFAGSEAFNQLRRWRDLTTDNQELLEQVAGLNELMVALANVGRLDIETFQDLQAEGSAAFESLTAAGFTQNEALAQMAPFLEDIIALHEDRGLAIDEETQKLIDQAKEHGILKEKEIATNDILMDGLGTIIELLGGELPKAWRTFADEGKQAASEVQESLNQIKAPSLEIPVRFLQPERFSADGIAPEDINNPFRDMEPQDFQHGGYIPPRPGGTLINVAEAGKGEWVIPEDIMDAWTRQPVSDSGSMLSHAEQQEGGHSAIKVNAPAVTVDNKIYIDGREVAFSLAPHLPAAVRPYGVTRR